MSPNDFKVLVIGGGNCGLAIATGLKKAGIACTVFERDTQHDFVHKARDWGMLLHWGTEYLQRVLPDDLLARFKEPRVDPHYEMMDPIPYVNGETGEVMGSVTTELINRVSRKKLRRFLTVGRDLHIEYAKVLQSIDVPGNEVSVKFDDGSCATGNMVIGSDGSRSKVREFLVGKEAAQLEQIGLTMINYASPKGAYTAEQARQLRAYHPIVKLSMHPRMPGGALLAALDIPDPDDPTGWTFQNYTSWWGPPYAADLQDPVARTKCIKERMSMFCEPFRMGFLALPDETVLPVYPGQQWAPTMGWDNHCGRVTIAGDAAHSMLPHRGQGLNNAMKDAADIVDAIELSVSGQTTLAEAVTAYEEEMRPRGAKEVQLSLEQAEKSRPAALHDSPLFKTGHQRYQHGTLSRSGE